MELIATLIKGTAYQASRKDDFIWTNHILYKSKLSHRGDENKMDMKVNVNNRNTTDAGILNQEVSHVGIAGKK